MVGIVAFVAVPALTAGAAQAQVWRFHEPHVLGASLDLAIVANDPAQALIAARAARVEITRLDAVLSRWRPDSELSALNSLPEMAISPDLFAVVQAAEQWRGLTGGAFDARLGRGAPLDLDGIAKGHVIDAALAAARRAAPQISGLMVDIGGDLRVWGQAPSPDGWRIGVADPARLQDNAEPAQTLWLSDKAVAFSGPGLRDGPDGAFHILDPRTGRPAARTSAAVVADSARDADALATALCVMPPAEGIALADRLAGFEALAIDADGRRLATRGWKGLARPDPPARLILAQAAQPWPSGFDLTINYEIPVIQRARAQPPYIAVWITDHTGAAVRTLTLLGNDDRFIDQNFIWWRKVGRVSGDVDALTRPTRRPGRYSLVWDGRDDKDRPVGQGLFTVHIEAAREHGTHGYQTFDLVLGGAPVTGSAEGQMELGPADVRYGPHR